MKLQLVNCLLWSYFLVSVNSCDSQVNTNMCQFYVTATDNQCTTFSFQKCRGEEVKSTDWTQCMKKCCDGSNSNSPQTYQYLQQCKMTNKHTLKIIGISAGSSIALIIILLVLWIYRINMQICFDTIFSKFGCHCCKRQKNQNQQKFVDDNLQKIDKNLEIVKTESIQQKKNDEERQKEGIYEQIQLSL